MSNSVAMALLKNTLAQAEKDGVIQININRSVHSADSTDSESVQSQTSRRSITSHSDDTQLVNKGEDKTGNTYLNN